MADKTLAIIGAGHLGQQIAHFATSDNHFKTVIYFDDFVKEKTVKGFPVIGNLSAITQAFDEGKFDEIIIGIGYKHLSARKEFFERFQQIIPFATIIHSSSWIDPTSEIKAGSVIYPSCVIDQRVVISENSILNLNCTISHDSIIGKNCFLSPSVSIAGFVIVGESCNIGINSTIIDNVQIISNTQTGGGTVVINNIEKSGLYIGNPHKFLKSI